VSEQGSVDSLLRESRPGTRTIDWTALPGKHKHNLLVLRGAWLPSSRSVLPHVTRVHFRPYSTQVA